MPKISGEKTFKKPYPWLQKPSHKAVASFPSPARLKKPNKSKANFFFPRVRTPCGRCAQVIIERRGNTSDDGKEHKETPKRTQTKKNKQAKRGQRQFPHHPNRCFLCTEVRQVKRTGCVLSMGLNSLRKAVKRVSARARAKRSLSKGLRSGKIVTTRPLLRGKAWC